MGSNNLTKFSKLPRALGTTRHKLTPMSLLYSDHIEQFKFYLR